MTYTKTKSKGRELFERIYGILGMILIIFGIIVLISFVIKSGVFG